MWKLLKVILWICWIILLAAIIILIAWKVTWDDITAILTIILVGLIKIFQWIRANIGAIVGVLFVWFCIYVRKWLHELWDSITKMDQRYRDDLKEDAGRDELIDYKIKDIRERLEKLEKKSKSNKK